MANDDTTRRLGEVVAQHVDLVYAAALRQVVDPHLADDVTQAVFVMLAQRGERLPAEGVLAGWLVKVTRYTALTMVRARGRRQKYETAGSMNSGLRREPERGVEEGVREELVGMLDEGLMALKEEERAVLSERFLQGRNLAERAAALGLRPNTAAKRVERALGRLREYFAQRGVEALGSAGVVGLLEKARLAAPAEVRERAVAKAGTITVKLLPVAAIGAMMTVKVVTAGVVLAVVVIGGAVAVGHWRGGGVSGARLGSASPTGPVVNVATRAGRSVTTLHGTVVDETRKPVVHAFVGQGFSPFGDGYHSTYTDEAGKFEIPRVKVGDDLFVTVIAHGYMPVKVGNGAVDEAVPAIAVTLKKSPVEKFRFVDEHGAPLEGMVAEPVEWNSVDLRTKAFLKGAAGDPPWDGMISGEDGRVTWDFVPAGPVGFFFDKRQSNAYRTVQDTVKPFEGEKVIVVRDALKLQVKVVDEKTGAAVPTFECFFGEGNDAEHVSSWQAAGVKGEDGVLTYNVTDVSDMNFVRVEAPGYAPVVQSFSDAPAEVTLTYKLLKDAGIAAKVLRADGTAAAGAKVFLVTQEARFDCSFDDILNGPSSPGDPPFVKADDAGACRLPNSLGKPMRVTVVDEEGFAEVGAAALKKDGVIRLQPWASIEGVVKLGSEPMARGEVELMIEWKAGEAGPRVMLEQQAKADKQGNFVLTHVPPVALTVGRTISANSGEHYQGMTDAIHETPKAGETLRVTLGGEPHFVRGKIVAAGEHGPKSEWGFALGEMEAAGRPEYLSPEERATWKAISPDQRAVRIKEWRTPERIKKYQEALAAWQKQYPQHEAAFAVKRDGSFFVDGVPSGQWDLSVEVMDAASWHVIGTAKATVVVKEQGETDLGEVIVEMKGH